MAREDGGDYKGLLEKSCCLYLLVDNAGKSSATIFSPWWLDFGVLVGFDEIQMGISVSSPLDFYLRLRCVVVGGSCWRCFLFGRVL